MRVGSERCLYVWGLGEMQSAGKEARWGTVVNQPGQDLLWDFPGGAVVKNPPANAGDMGLSPGPERSHMPWSN